MNNNNNHDNSIITSWLLTVLTIIANITMQDIATFFVILSAGISSGYTLWKWKGAIKRDQQNNR
jgi:hypothetical protein